jgi:hypothetical protein
MTSESATPATGPGARPGTAPMGAPQRSRLRIRSRAGRSAALIALAAAVAAFTTVWALPNIAGRFFVQVHALARAVPAANGPTVILGGDAPVQARAVEISLEIDNGYPLAVVLDTSPTPYHASVYHRENTGHLARVWEFRVGDPALEEGSDSPMGGATSGAVVVPSGVTRIDVATGTAAFGLVGSTGSPLPAGVYYLRVWAYGIGSPMIPMSIDEAGPLPTPAALPTLGP